VFEQEVVWINAALEGVPAEALSPMLNIGSSTLEFRTRTQPFIDAGLFAPLTARGVKVVHADLKQAPGVDLTADILTEAGFAEAKAVGAKSLLLCNLLEHVTDPGAFTRRAWDLVQPGGLIVVSVPRSYPYHRDPIDTLLRPTPAEVAALFPAGAEVVSEAVIETGYYWDKVKVRPWLLLRPILRAPFPFLGLTKWKRSLGKLYWLVKPYLATMVVLRKPAAG
jgi:SAM-dependent methyltransferase